MGENCWKDLPLASKYQKAVRDHCDTVAVTSSNFVKFYDGTPIGNQQPITVTTVNQFETIMEKAWDENFDRVLVLGGRAVYNSFEAYADEVNLTVVNGLCGGEKKFEFTSKGKRQYSEVVPISPALRLERYSDPVRQPAAIDKLHNPMEMSITNGKVVPQTPEHFNFKPSSVSLSPDYIFSDMTP